MSSFFSGYPSPITNIQRECWNLTIFKPQPILVLVPRLDLGMEIIQGSQQRPHLFFNNFIQFLMLLLFFSCIMSVCLSASPPSFYYNLQGLDRKYMFLICNAILAVLTNTLKFDHSSFTHGSVAEVNQVTAAELLTPAVHENLASMVELEQDQLAAAEEEDSGGFQKGCNSASMTEQEHLEEEDHGGFQKGAGESEDDDDDDEVEEGCRAMEEKEMASMDARVSTDELNKKIEDFIRKMKEEIRIEAQHQQPLVTV